MSESTVQTSEALVQRIVSDAEKRAEEIVIDAKFFADDLNEKANAEAAALSDEIAKKAAKDAEDIKKAKETLSAIENKKTYLTAKQNAVEMVYLRALEKLSAMKKDEYLALIGGLLLSAIIAAAMSTADSQLLAASSAFSSDIYKAVLRKEASDKEMLWVGRIAVAVILVIALLIALFVSSSIMSLVSAAWSIFGASFGPVMILALYWRRFNFKGACAAIISGFAVSVLWMVLFNFEYYGFTSLVYNTGLYEIIPGFVVGLIVAIVVSILTKEPNAEITALFDSVGRSVENYEVEVEEEVEVAEEVPVTAAEISIEE